MNISTYRAKWLLPISRPPIQNGWIAVTNDRVVAIGSAHQSPPSKALNLGDVAILPALVNAHTHLEFSSLTQPIGYPGIKLHDWIGEVVRARQANQANPSDIAATIQRGIWLSHAAGVGLVGDIATTPMPSFASADDCDCQVISMAEVLGLNPSRSQAKLSQAKHHISQFKTDRQFHTGISPHAPYSTPLSIVQQCVQIANEHRLPLAMHVAESDEERQLIEQGDGPLAETLKQIQAYSPELFPWGHDATLELLKQLVQAPQTLIVHGNHLLDHEVDFLAKHPNVTVVYCPRTHAFFEHPPHPVLKLLNRNIRVALGTDSLASNPDLSIWKELQWLLSHRQDIPWHAVLEMATINAADAFARPDLGRLEIGACAKLLTIATSTNQAEDLPSALLANQPVRFIS